MNLLELIQLMKQHKISGSSYLNKPEMIKRLIDKEVLTREEVEKWKPPPPKETSKDPKYDWLKHIRMRPRRTTILDHETGETVSYPSMYKAAKALNRSSRIIAMYDGQKPYLKRYEIKVYDSPSDGTEDLIKFDESSSGTTSEDSTGDEKDICLTCGEEEARISSDDVEDLIVL